LISFVLHCENMAAVTLPVKAGTFEGIIWQRGCE